MIGEVAKGCFEFSPADISHTRPTAAIRYIAARRKAFAKPAPRGQERKTARAPLTDWNLQRRASVLDNYTDKKIRSRLMLYRGMYVVEV